MRKTAEILGVSKVTVRRWIRNGWIRAYRVGPQAIRIPRSEIVRMRSIRLPYVRYGDRPEYTQV